MIPPEIDFKVGDVVTLARLTPAEQNELNKFALGQLCDKDDLGVYTPREDSFIVTTATALILDSSTTEEILKIPPCYWVEIQSERRGRDFFNPYQFDKC